MTKIQQRTNHVALKTLAIIPARGRSKGIHKKNTVMLNGKPLISYTIEAAINSKVFDKIAVTTEDKQIIQVVKKYNEVCIIKRPISLATSKAPTEPAMLHVIKYLEKYNRYTPEVVCLLQPTSPLRDSKDIRTAFKHFRDSNADSLLSVSMHYGFIWQKHRNYFAKPINYNYLNRPRRQEKNSEYEENGAIYFVKQEIFIKNNNRLGGNIAYYVMPKERSLEIDTLLDLKIAKMILTT